MNEPSYANAVARLAFFLAEESVSQTSGGPGPKATYRALERLRAEGWSLQHQGWVDPSPVTRYTDGSTSCP